MFTLDKGKALVSMSDVKVYNKKTLSDKIRRLIIVKIQLIIDKIETEKIKVNLKIDKIQLFGEKNSLVVKRKKLRIEIVILNIANALIRRH